MHNGMTRMHDNEVNHIYECNLLHDILNNPERTNKLSSHYSFIIHGCMNTISIMHLNLLCTFKFSFKQEREEGGGWRWG